MNLENFLTGGRATWLDLLTYDPARERVELRTIHPDEPQATRHHMVFTGVSKYAEEPFDSALPRDASVWEGLLGLDVHVRKPATWYVIHTEQRAVSFYTEKEPAVEAIGPRG